MPHFSQKTKDLTLIALLLLLGCAAAFYIARCTQLAPWGFSDSAAYLSAARNLALGHGLSVTQPDGSFAPLLIFAPFFSIFLSPFALASADLVAVVRAFDMVAFALLIASSGWLFYRLTSAWIASLLFALMIFATPVLAVLYTSIMSEPLALVLGIPGFLLTLLAIKEESTKKLLLAALLCGLALLTRYAFAAFPAAAILCLLLLSKKPFRRRLNPALKFALLSLAPMLAWILIQLASSYSVGSRHYSLDFSLAEKLRLFFSQLYEVVKYWLPYRTDLIPGLRAEVGRPILLGLLTLVLLAGAILAFRKRRQPSHQPLWLMLTASLILMACYALVLFATYTLSTELISLDERMFAPLLPILYLLLLAAALALESGSHAKIPLPFAALLIAACFGLYNYHDLRVYPTETGTYPNGYTSPVWNGNPLLDGSVPLPQERPLLSNAPDILLFYLNRGAFWLDSAPSAQDMHFTTRDPAALKVKMSADCALLLLFDPNAAERYQMNDYALSDADLLQLQSEYQVLYSSPNGQVLMDAACPPPAGFADGQ